MNRLEIVRAARSLVGVPFHHGGRNPEFGLDCGGLLIAVCQKLKYPYEDLGYSYSRIGPEDLLAITRKNFDERKFVGEREPGDVGLFWTSRRYKTPAHLGIFTPNGVVHCVNDTTGKGGVVEHSMDSSWRRRITHVFQFRGAEWPH